MKIIQNVNELQQMMLQHKRTGQRIALVPTMGFLHQGHVSLLQKGRELGDLLVLSIFVNPTQFGPGEDLERYPRNLEADCQIAAGCGVDYVLAPSVSEVYPDRFQTKVSLGSLTAPLCGASRPGHFDGVATVVAKLFGIVQPDLALFGKKDFQQLAIIRQMVSDLNMAVEIVGMPIVREPDGLAMSSRNSYLNRSERQQAVALYRAICKVRIMFDAGVTAARELIAAAHGEIGKAADATVDYLELCNSRTLMPMTEATTDTLLALAVKIGSTRLIDNTVLGEEL